MVFRLAFIIGVLYIAIVLQFENAILRGVLFSIPVVIAFAIYMYFKQRKVPQNKVQGSDQVCPLNITLDEAYSGVTKEITIPRNAICGICKGSGQEKKKIQTTCQVCLGSGRKPESGRKQSSRYVCSNCNGKGIVNKVDCRDCQSSGFVESFHAIKIHIPSGVSEGNKLRLERQGHEGLGGGENGDLYFIIHILPHNVFQVEGRDLICNVTISEHAAAQGIKTEVEALNGEMIKVAFPPNTKAGQQFCIEGRGLPAFEIESPELSGDLFLHIEVEEAASV